MEGIVAQFVSHIATCLASASSNNLLSSIPLDEAHPFFGPLKQALANTSPSHIAPASLESYVSAAPTDVKDNVAALISAVLRFIKGSTAPSESERAYEDFAAFQQAYSEANKIYGTSSPDGPYLYPFLNPLILQFARLVVHRSSTAASLSTYPLRHSRSARSIRDATRQVIERSIQIASSSMSAEEWESEAAQEHSVGDIIWPLANILFRIYAERKLHTQSTELQKSLHNLSPAEDKRLASRGFLIAATDICQSYYWRGKLGVVLLDMRGAVFWLNKAWRMCPDDDMSWKQKRSILIRLIPVNLLLGLLPSTETLQEYDLPHFYSLIQAFKTGNVPVWRRILEEQREWFRRRSIWLILYERGEMLVWRNLYRSALTAYYDLDPQARQNSRCPTWVFTVAAGQVFEGTGEVEDGTITIEDTIVILASLIDQSLVLGNLSYSHKQLAMKRSEDGMGGFPKISLVVPRRVDAIA
ncbi:hypothetical protein B9479_002924 [Cryptococcus floricola]|uniref:PCI domain-containing protein n=1 Tax=Cryptococcus floricola TaxID=2591691 RepID=A0A5D3B2E5_9TREE|nr:hypothetical protein B9479_002924 [Cryptococcus floricola]